MTIMRNDKAFTGLEAAIVLIAFVVVAAVFSYVVLGAGFFTTQKSQEVVHTGVSQASSSMEIIGQVYGHAVSTTKNSASVAHLAYIRFTIGNTAGGTGLDVTDMVVSYADESTRDSNVEFLSDTGSLLIGKLEEKSNQEGLLDKKLAWGVIEKINHDGDDMLESGSAAVRASGCPFRRALQPRHLERRHWLERQGNRA